MGAKRKFSHIQEERMVQVRYVDAQVLHRTLWNVVADLTLTYHRARPCIELSRKDFFFRQNEFLYNFPNKKRKK